MPELQDAIALVRQGNKAEAQKILEVILRANPKDVPAWFWYAETCDPLEKRIKVLETCLRANPGHSQAIQALDRLRAKANEAAQASVAATPAPVQPAPAPEPEPPAPSAIDVAPVAEPLPAQPDPEPELPAPSAMDAAPVVEPLPAQPDPEPEPISDTDAAFLSVLTDQTLDFELPAPLATDWLSTASTDESLPIALDPEPVPPASMAVDAPWAVDPLPAQPDPEPEPAAASTMADALFVGAFFREFDLDSKPAVVTPVDAAPTTEPLSVQFNPDLLVTEAETPPAADVDTILNSLNAELFGTQLQAVAPAPQPVHTTALDIPPSKSERSIFMADTWGDVVGINWEEVESQLAAAPDLSQPALMIDSLPVASGGMVLDSDPVWSIRDDLLSPATETQPAAEPADANFFKEDETGMATSLNWDFQAQDDNLMSDFNFDDTPTNTSDDDDLLKNAS